MNNIDYTIDDRRTASRFMLALNSTLRRLTGGVFGLSPDGKRNYNVLYGYGESLAFSDFYGMYRRGGIAKTIVSKVAKTCWRDIPRIESNGKEILLDEINTLKNSGLFKSLEKADILNRIGRFSVLVIGVADGQKLDQPISSANNFNDMYFSPYSEDGTTVIKWDQDPGSARYGLPVLYQVQTTTIGIGSKGIQTQSRVVHWSRVVHLAEGALDDPFDGCSSLEAPWNCLIDKEKVRGGSAEAYFRNARQKYSLEANADTQIDQSAEALALLKTEVEAFDNDQQSFMRLQNMKAHVMQPGMISPRDAFDVAIEEIAGETGIPIRILTGKGGGQLAGAEDKASWNALISDRQSSECSNYLTQALVIFSKAGLIDLPENYEIIWPVQPSLNESEASEAISKRASAASSIADTIIKLGEDASPTDVLELAGFHGVNITTEDIEDV